MIIAQISDPHVSVEGGELWGGYEPDFAFSAVLEAVAAVVPRPDLVLFTGDLTETGAPEEYANFLRLVAGIGLPMAAIPGNHDRRQPFVDALAPSRVAIGTLPWLHVVLEVHPLRVIALDSVAEGESRGLLCSDRLDWLQATLSEAPDRPALVFLHHPPFPTGIGFVDRESCRGAEALEAILRGHPQVAGVMAGHLHRPIHALWAGTVAAVAPGVAWEVPLDLAPGAGPRLDPQNPGFMLHIWELGRPCVGHSQILHGLF